MRAWALLLAGLAIWATHFFALYAIASLFPGQAVARWLVLGATVPALGIDAVLLRRAVRARRGEDPFERWLRGLAALGAALSGVAVLWQGVPALLA